MLKIVKDTRTDTCAKFKYVILCITKSSSSCIAKPDTKKKREKKINKFNTLKDVKLTLRKGKTAIQVQISR